MREATGQQWFHYSEWEDWRAGMYRNTLSPLRVDEARRILATPGMFYTLAASMMSVWPVATAHNLTNGYANHQPWIGRAACAYATAATIRDTTMAWCLLPPSAQAVANQVADYIADQWRTSNMKGQTAWTL